MATDISVELAQGMLPKRSPDAHKGTFGHLVVLAGSRAFTGAAKLVCRSAMRSGVGLVTACVPRTLADVFAASLTEAMTHLLPSSEQDTFTSTGVDSALEFSSDKSAVVLGPGISQHPHARDFALAFIEKYQGPLLIDADGLNALSTDKSVLKGREVSAVLTPHPGEMARLVGLSTKEVQQNRTTIAQDYATESKCVLVLKGEGTVVVSPDGDCFINHTGNSGLATAGTGDVLAGVIGGLLAQGLAPTDAAMLGVYVQGLAGDLAAKSKTERGMIASDVIEHLPEVWRHLERTD